MFIANKVGDGFMETTQCHTEIAFDKSKLQNKLASNFQLLNGFVSESYSDKGITPSTSRAIKQFTKVLYRNIALNHHFRKVRESLLSTVGKSGKECIVELYKEEGCEAKLYVIPSGYSISSESLSGTFYSLIVDYGSIEVVKKEKSLIEDLEQDRLYRLTQEQSIVGNGRSMNIDSFTAFTPTAIFFCICYNY